MAYQPITNFMDNVNSDTSSDAIKDYPKGKSENKIKIFPENLVFSATAANAESAPQSVLIQNEGFKDMVIDALIVSGDFALVGTAPVLVRAGEAEGIQVKFLPKRSGAHSGSVYVDSDKAEGKRLLSLSGSGT